MTIVDGVLAEFEKLVAIPRKSGEEKAVSDFLKSYLTEQGFRVVQDEVNNIIADAPATPGCEQAPRTILQGHMDMVCVAEDGYAYDPLRDPIKLVRSEKYLEAEGTSLGADDGIGVAEGIYLLKNAKEHGPLRLIVTVDEERGMTGAIHLAPEHLTDAQFLINCDSENYDELTVGSAGSVDITFERALQHEPSPAGTAYRLSVGGLLGGHSGERIGDGRGNALRTLAFLLQALSQHGAVAVADFHGGKAHNAIPDTAEAVFVTAIPKEEMSQILTAEKEKFLAIYGAVDPKVEFVLQETEKPAEVLRDNVARALLQLLTLVHTGVFAMSTVIPTLVETSANLGVVRMTEGKIAVEYFPRSAVDGKLDEFI
ncbi:MAG: M20/M25/M40 family metallo-hydrolase, partial [Selenomonas bovis]